jgi:D-arabinose 1-dehydrogenase-like Zn-dependent alcohol dehydrogenase
MFRFCINKFHIVGGVGSSACQIAKKVLGAAKVITTVSTEKVGRVDQLLGKGVVDEGTSSLNISCAGSFLTVQINSYRLQEE